MGNQLQGISVAINNAANNAQIAFDQKVQGGLRSTDNARKSLDRWSSGFEVAGVPLRAGARLGEEGTHFLIGLAHGVVGLGTGLANFFGDAGRLATSPKDRSRFFDALHTKVSHSASIAQAGGQHGASFFKEDPAYVLGDFASLLIPPALAFGVTGKALPAAGGFAAGLVALQASPNRPDFLRS